MNIFTAVKYCCILHGRVFVMQSTGWEAEGGYLTVVFAIVTAASLCFVSVLLEEHIRHIFDDN